MIVKAWILPMKEGMKVTQLGLLSVSLAILREKAMMWEDEGRVLGQSVAADGRDHRTTHWNNPLTSL
jgi:hypothetical protein